MMKHTLYIIMCLLTLTAGAKALTLDEVRRRAEANYPLVREYSLISQTEQYTVENAAKAWLPQVSAAVQGSWQSAVAAYPDVLKDMLAKNGMDMKGMSKWQYKVGVDVSQTIWDGGRTRAAKQLAKAEAEESRIADDVELHNLRCRVDEIFFSVLLLERQRDVLKATEELLKANLRKVQSLVSNGAAMQSDADAVEVELISTEQQTASVQSTIRAYRSILGLYIGSKGDETLEMPTDEALPLTNNSALRPEQRLLDARNKTLLAHEQEVKASVLPQIKAFAQGYFGYPGMNYMEAMMKRDPSFNAMVGVTASWNIASLYTKKNRLKKIKAAQERIEVGRDVFSFNTDLQATQQRNDIQRLRDIAEKDDKIEALRRRVRVASEARLREGVVEPTDLLLRITEEKNAIIAANSHRIEYIKAVNELKSTLNCK